MATTKYLVTGGAGFIGSNLVAALANAGERFHALLGHACDEAELGGREIGVVVGSGGYAFARLDGGDWRDFGNDGELRPRSWPAGVRIEFTREGRPLALATPDHGTPQLVCFSSGELTPFSLVLSLGDAARRYRLRGADDGSVQVDRIGPAP